MDMFKTGKRRAVQKARQVMGAERTVDEQFDQHSQTFVKMHEDIDQLGIGLFTCMKAQRDFFENASKLSVCFDDFYSGQYKREWQGENPAHFADVSQAARYSRDRWKYLNDVVRRSAAQIQLDNALTPVRVFTNETGKEVIEQIEHRNGACIDFDSYRRRLKDLEKGGKTDNPAYMQMEAKRDRARDQFEQSNGQVKDTLIRTKMQRDQIIEHASLVTAACQLELMYMTANYLQEVVSALPPAKAQVVTETRTKIRELVNLGGPDLQEDKKSNLVKTFELATGKALPSDYREAEEEAKRRKELQEQRREQVQREQAITSPGGVNVELGGSGIEWVIADFDCNGEQDDELSFKIGDRIKLVNKDDNGWWMGELKGKTGVFPSNYVRVPTPQELKMIPK